MPIFTLSINPSVSVPCNSKFVPQGSQRHFESLLSEVFFSSFDSLTSCQSQRLLQFLQVPVGLSDHHPDGILVK